jgi:hypothetical protein
MGRVSLTVGQLAVGQYGTRKSYCLRLKLEFGNCQTVNYQTVN